ncbi:unnamed protein product (macronuclear) [Paramecium tetraurelia]|uniref:Enkurin domain-containing protein n=1 Tax=Paramecium tetraurelia TaxID=5888 RepID=A0DVA6_PARTE|nr:uncharacterized protein GSPATT00020637001 [Paramecium tetraurelia]CAK86973.1 unnamed protein product [Paramecium tetraurelia]|eukprot:XP_001454370.1 hypothetical protein (macronuclear) [Paramecium tetraurelia strain d4-2]
MLKFLENRDPPRFKRGQDFMRFESNSHLPNNKQFNSPLHQDVLIHHDKPQYYVTKKLPPVSIYNPLVQLTDKVDRPEYIIKQKEVYHPRYMEEYQMKGFRKKQGIFESFQHLLNKNQILIEGVHSDKKPVSFPVIKEEFKKIYKSLNLDRQQSSRSQDSSKVDKSNQDTSRSYINSYNKNYNYHVSEQSKLRTEHKSIQVSLEKMNVQKKTEQSKEFQSKILHSYLIRQEEEAEKERQMRQLSIFDKKIKELRIHQDKHGRRKMTIEKKSD